MREATLIFLPDVEARVQKALLPTLSCICPFIYNFKPKLYFESTDSMEEIILDFLYLLLKFKKIAIYNRSLINSGLKQLENLLKLQSNWFL